MWRWIYSINRILHAVINGNHQAGGAAAWSMPWGLSAIVHAAGLGILAAFAISNTQPAELETVLSEWNVPETAIQIERPVDDSRVMRASSGGGRPGAAGPLANGLETAKQQAQPVRETNVPVLNSGNVTPLDLDSRLPPATDLVASALGTKLGKGFALGGGFGSGFGSGTGNGSGSGFFDLETAGTKFVYVLDGSGSMTEPHSEARTRLDRVKLELVRSIGGLAGDMQFFVVFFNRVAVPMPAAKLQMATGTNKQKYLEWVVKVQGGGGTDPRPALKQALELRPDVIFFLTDGVFDDKVADEVTRLNTRGVSIHTFCFGDVSGEALLQAIARRNQGMYKYVP